MSLNTAVNINTLNNPYYWSAEWAGVYHTCSLNYPIDVFYTSNRQNNDILNYDPSVPTWKNNQLSTITSNYSNADGGYYYETYSGIAGKVDGGVI